MTAVMFAQTVSELAGWLVILTVVTVATLVLSRRAKVRADQQKRMNR